LTLKFRGTLHSHRAEFRMLPFLVPD